MELNNDIKSFIENVRNLIAKAKLDEAIELFIDNPFNLKDEVIVQSAQYNNLKNEITRGIKTNEEANVERNKICY